MGIGNSLRRKRFDRPDGVRQMELGRIELVELGELALGRAIFEPGWRWSDHVKPIAGTASCMVHHVGYVVSGHLHVEMDDGATIELRAGDAYVLATIVFTDLSGSTKMVRRLGDAAWRALLAEHNQAVRAEIERHAGREVHTTGDGFLALFDSPARAVRGAAAMIGAAARLGLTARAVVHTGEVELQDDDVRGIAVHMAARILELAEPGEVLASSMVRELLTGSGLEFMPRGEFELRGIEGRRALASLAR